MARDRVDGVSVLDRVKRAFGRRDHELLAHLEGARVAQTVRVRDRFDRDVVVVRHRREGVALVDRDLLHRSRAFGGDRYWIAAGGDCPAACQRLGARGVARGGGRCADRRRSDRARSRRGRGREWKRQNEHRDGSVECESKSTDPDETREVAAASVESEERKVTRPRAGRDGSLGEKTSVTLKDPFWVRCGL